MERLIAMHPELASAPVTHTKRPIVTGTSVIAVKYADGVMMAADTLGSYGGLARFKDLRRIRAIGDFTLIGAGGEYSDFQHIMKTLEKAEVSDFCEDDGCVMGPDNIHSYLTRVMYHRRNKGDPLWNSLLVAGVRDGNVFLGYIDSIGTAFQDDFITTGFGTHLALPHIRSNWKPGMSEAEARKLLEDCMKTLYYRDCRTINKMTFATVTAQGQRISEPVSLATKWNYPSFVNPKAGADSDGSW